MAQEDTWNNLHWKESMLKYKSRLKWVKESDLNTKYFHFMLNCRTRRNSITSIQVGSKRVEDVGLVNKAITEHFELRFSNNFIQRPNLDWSEFSRLTRDESLRLEEMFST